MEKSLLGMGMKIAQNRHFIPSKMLFFTIFSNILGIEIIEKKE